MSATATEENRTMWNNVEVIESKSNDDVRKYVFTSATAVAESVLYKYPT